MGQRAEKDFRATPASGIEVGCRVNRGMCVAISRRRDQEARAYVQIYLLQYDLDMRYKGIGDVV
jgi:hypothetical protein